MCIYDGRSPACVSTSPLSNWMECGASDTTKMWHIGTGALPCNISVATDGGTPVLDVQYLPSYSSFGQTGGANNVRIETVTGGGTPIPPLSDYFNYPQGSYVETVYRVARVVTNTSQNQHAVWSYALDPNSCPLDYEFGELYTKGSATNLGDSAFSQQVCNTVFGFMWASTGNNTLTPGWDILHYHKYAGMMTNNGTDSTIGCSYVDDILQLGDFNGCHDALPTGGATGQVTDRFYLIAFVSADSAPYPDVTQDVYVQYIRVWSCASWATTQCSGSTLVGTRENGAVAYWH
jgi:hypothetical protein